MTAPSGEGGGDYTSSSNNTKNRKRNDNNNRTTHHPTSTNENTSSHINNNDEESPNLSTPRILHGPSTPTSNVNLLHSSQSRWCRHWKTRCIYFKYTARSF
mmetsp:Transcript_16845/g.22595  ORF Transcript_16845/g.22595 Transcript_16845/m.22595 type:complete len:101 (+) Transcript_16845:127-429(+)